jgi:threonine/homoserine/homoserine lactone efflux protein
VALAKGRIAACVSSIGAALGLLAHVLGAVIGLALVIQTSSALFGLIKVIGAAYLIWLGVKALRSRDLISFTPGGHLPLRTVFSTGFLTNVLNPKPAIFVLAFVTQLVDSNAGSVTHQMLAIGIWFAILAFAIFSVMGSSASILRNWLNTHPRTTIGLNMGAGLALIAAGLSVLLLERKSTCRSKEWL